MALTLEGLVAHIIRCHELFYEAVYGDCSDGIRIIIGNEACDLDSFVSSYVASYLFTLETPDIVHIPFINVEQNLVQLRPDVMYAIQQVLRVDFEMLLYREHLDEFTQATSCDIILIDHNVLAISQYSLSSRVRGVIDHHPVQSHISYCRDVCNAAASLGSCMSCIMLYFKQFPLPNGIFEQCMAAPADSRERTAVNAYRGGHVTDISSVDAPFIKLMILPIMMDTDNARKTHVAYTSVDDELLNYYSSMLDANESRDQIFHTIKNARLNIGSFSSYDLCYRDYKTFNWNWSYKGKNCQGKMGIASIPISLGEWKSVQRVGMKSLSMPDGMFENIFELIDYVMSKDELTVFIAHCANAGHDAYLDEEYPGSTVASSSRQMLLYYNDNIDADDQTLGIPAKISSLNPDGEIRLTGLNCIIYGVDGKVSRKMLVSTLYAGVSSITE